MATRKQLEQHYIEERAFWGSVSSRWRGLAGGFLLGGMLGLSIGLVAAVGFSAASGIAFAEMGKGTLLGLVGFFTGAGMLFGGNLWGGGGQVSGAVAGALMAQKELDKGKAKELAQEVPLENVPEIPDKQPLVNWKVAGLGAAVAGSIGAFLAYSGSLPAGGHYIMLGQQAGTGMGALAAGMVLGTLGTVFGIAFRPWRAFKQWSDGLFEGKTTGRSAPALEPLREHLLATAPEQPAPETQSTRRYTETVLQQRAQSSLDSPTLQV